MLKLGFIVVCFLPFTFALAANHHPQEFLQSIKGTKDEGAQIVKHFCSSCHAEKPLIPLGAPRVGNENDWTPRVKNGIKSLFKHTEEGFNAMPARGGCFECSDEQLVLALIAMLPEPLKKEVLSDEKDKK
ncbi:MULTISPECIES: c-type cytochrome [Legionella]|uniref:Cytochrome c5 n=1 Tax=Legionella drozanskii LLAP-1 TaxID=1212489 RepID=A0A0W0TBV0_9GAMM|nr:MULTISPECIES: c-type cytochrome [Legionella]KTC93091.1 cytochrome c5 [Legionella drozanskii LLAP-1]PJE11993.1 MAG: cytochrome c5 family protein [Legionella sp.]